MKHYAFRILNVFAREDRLSGNPLCVFENGEGLDDAQMQAIARQFNLSETTFVLPSISANARVRIFTPSHEMPFAGHPTLGTAHVVRAVQGGDALTLEMTAGIIPVNATGDRWTLRANAPRWREVVEPRAQLAALLGLDPGDIAERPLWVSTGREQLLVPLTSEDAVRRVRPAVEAFSVLQSEDGPGRVYVFADSGSAVLARYFSQSGAAVLEDAATGSACANLGGWFIATQPGADVERTISQGEAVQRPSTLQLCVKEGEIRVGGRVIELGRGSIGL